MSIDAIISILGLSLVAIGSWWIYPPMALIVVGGVLLCLVVVGNWRRTK